MSLSRVLTSVLSYLPNSSSEDTSFESQGDVSHMHAFLHQNAPKQSPCKELKNKTNSIVSPLRSCWKRQVYTLITIKLSLPVNITSFPKTFLKEKMIFLAKRITWRRGLAGPLESQNPVWGGGCFSSKFQGDPAAAGRGLCFQQHCWNGSLSTYLSSQCQWAIPKAREPICPRWVKRSQGKRQK